MADPTTVRARRQRFWAENGFPSDGGYDDAWAEASFAGIPYVVPNPRARGNALRVHDLHHVLTGYRADWRGESEIASWELGSGGGGGFAYAWFIAIFGFVVGLLALPRRTWEAFRRGRTTSNLYGRADPMRVLDLNVDDTRALLPSEGRRRGWLRDALAFAAAAVVAVPLGLIFLAGTPALVLLALGRMRCPLRSGTLAA